MFTFSGVWRLNKEAIMLVIFSIQSFWSRLFSANDLYYFFKKIIFSPDECRKA